MIWRTTSLSVCLNRGVGFQGAKDGITHNDSARGLLQVYNKNYIYLFVCLTKGVDQTIPPK